MNFVVEDGTGLSTANAYVSVADINTYWADRGIFDWNNGKVKETLIITATDYIDRTWGGKLSDIKFNSTQALEFPRSQSAPLIPLALKKACFELAKIAATQELYSKTLVNSDSDLSRKKVKVGPVETETEYFSRGRGTRNIYPSVEGLIRSLIGSSNSVIK